MIKNQAFLLCMLQMAKTILEETKINPSLRRKAFSIFPARFNMIPITKVGAGIPVYKLRDRPTYMGLVESVHKSKDGENYTVQYVSGHSEVFDSSCCLFTCCNT